MGSFPVYPRVYTRDYTVIIEYENGRRELWGMESSIGKALRVAEELQLGLRLISYIHQEVDASLNSIRESLVSVAPGDLVEEVLTEELWLLIKRATINENNDAHFSSPSSSLLDA